MKALYKFELDCGRMGDLSGIFVAEKEQVQQRIGKEIYYGECLGKHSEIMDILEEGSLKVVSEDPAVTELFESNDLETGTNPMRHNWRGDDGAWVEV